MKVQPSCFPCILRRVLATAGHITDDPWLQHKVLGKVMAELADADRDLTPAELMTETLTHVVKTLGAPDPFQKERDYWFQELEAIVAKIEERVLEAEDPLARALAFAARANIFDDEAASRAQVRRELNRLGLKKDGDVEPDVLTVDDDYAGFLKSLEEAETLLFLHDSGPGMIFDKFVLDEIVRRRPELKITSVVRSQPILLDATREDAKRSGVEGHPAVESVIDPGTLTLGCPPNDCTREFRETLEAADLVVGKGQAHVETLESLDRRIYFLLRVKCTVMANEQGVKRGDTLFLRS